MKYATHQPGCCKSDWIFWPVLSIRSIACTFVFASHGPESFQYLFSFVYFECTFQMRRVYNWRESLVKSRCKYFQSMTTLCKLARVATFNYFSLRYKARHDSYLWLRLLNRDIPLRQIQVSRPTFKFFWARHWLAKSNFPKQDFYDWFSIIFIPFPL